MFWKLCTIIVYGNSTKYSIWLSISFWHQYSGSYLWSWHYFLFIIIIIIIITLFKSQIFLAEDILIGETVTWNEPLINSNQMKCWFLRRGENWRTRGKTSKSRVENQHTQPTDDAESGNRTRDTLVEGKHFHHCANPASYKHLCCHKWRMGAQASA